MEPPKKRLCLRLSIPHPAREPQESEENRKSSHRQKPIRTEDRALPIRQWAVQPSVPKIVEDAHDGFSRLIAKSWERSPRTMLGIRFGEFTDAGIKYATMYARKFSEETRVPLDMLCPKVDHRRCTDDQRKQCGSKERIVPVWIVPFFLEHIHMMKGVFRTLNNPVRIGFNILGEVGEAVEDNNYFGVQEWHASIVREAVEVAARMTDELLEIFKNKATRSSQRYQELDIKYKGLKSELDAMRERLSKLTRRLDAMEQGLAD